jgi:hypothetical protein
VTAHTVCDGFGDLAASSVVEEETYSSLARHRGCR